MEIVHTLTSSDLVHSQVKSGMYLVAITKGYHMPKTVKGKKKKKIDSISPSDVVYEYPEMEEFLKVSC